MGWVVRPPFVLDQEYSLKSTSTGKFVAGDVGGGLDTNAIFLFANLIAMVRCTITEVLTQLDGLILMHLSGGTIFSVLSVWGYRTCHYQEEGPKGIRHFGGFGTHLRLLLSLAVSCYGLWFWLTGITNGVVQHEGDENGPCATVYTFMFAKVRAAGGIKIFYIIVCILCVIYFGIMLLASSLAGYARLAKMINLARQHKWRSTSKLHFATGLRQKQYVRQSISRGYCTSRLISTLQASLDFPLPSHCQLALDSLVHDTCRMYPQL